MARVHAIATPGIDDLAVFDHAAFGKHHHLATAQDVTREQRHETRVVIRHHTQVAQHAREAVVPCEQFRRSDRAAQVAGLLVDQVLRDEGLHPREMIEQEDFAAI